MTIKKAYVELIAFLEENKTKKVSSIIEELRVMCEAKNASSSDTGTTFLKDDEGVVIAIYCYYHKCWEPLSHVEYGAKKGTASGYNTMCKEGVSCWTKQQRIAKQSKELLLDKLSSGELELIDLQHAQDEIEVKRKEIVASTHDFCFSNVDTLNEWLVS